MVKEKIKHFPISAFTVIMGLSGLTLVFSKFAHAGWLPNWCFNLSFILVSLMFVLITSMYLLKILMFREFVTEEFRHPVKVNFFPAISISLLLLAVVTEQLSHNVSFWFWITGTVLHTVLMLKAIGYWIEFNYQIHHFNPSWFIPAVGNVLVPISGMDHAPMLISYFFFASGMFFWFVLFVIFLNRVVFHGQLPEKFIPTLFILIAPPAVGFISYTKIFFVWDSFSLFLLMMGYFFILLLLSMYRSFTRLKFYMSWWAFTFPMTAITLATTLAYEKTGIQELQYIAWALGGISVILIAIVAWFTTVHLIKGEICVMEDS